ncbi:MAG: threonine synthase [Chloroflexota bacterium]|nr:threonine synthase [Chloroflexota bacterium]
MPDQTRQGRAHFRCYQCARPFSLGTIRWRCPCGGYFDVAMDAQFPWVNMQERRPGLWRYREALPFARDLQPVTLGETVTPLVPVADKPCQISFKLDYFSPTGSFKDRGATVLISQARELNVSSVVEDSSGNAGAAIAAYAAAAGIAATIFVPESASQSKLAQINLYGASVISVPGSRAATTRAAVAAAENDFYASHVWNPFFLEGTKTVAFELWEQLNQTVPDWVITPVGHGTMLLGLHKGFQFLRAAGITSSVPQLIAVQAAACAPLWQAWNSPGAGGLPEITPTPTGAEGIAISRPTRWQQCLSAIKTTGGELEIVTEAEIEDALLAWARRGFLMEPTSATAPAALEKWIARGMLKPHQRGVVIITGSGIRAAASLNPEAS